MSISFAIAALAGNIQPRKQLVILSWQIANRYVRTKFGYIGNVQIEPTALTFLWHDFLLAEPSKLCDGNNGSW